VRRMAYARPELLARIVDVNAKAVVKYLDAQIDSGADAVMVFDTWGGLLTADAYRMFSLAPMRAIVESLGKRTPTIVFTRGGGGWLREIAAIGAHCVGLDWTVDIASARAQVGDRVALQGNLDPVTLLTDANTVTRETERIVRAAGAAPGHVFNLGHGILPTTPPDNVAALVEAVHRTSREVRAGA
jgi:uroporphyrinogen decarboxylase